MQKKMLEDNKDVIQDIGKLTGGIGVQTTKGIIDENEEDLKNIATKGANVTINNVELKVKYSASGRNMFYVNNATLTVNSGNFEVLNTGIKYLALQNNARAYVKGGTFEDLMAKGQEAVYTDGGAALEITGGKFQVATTNYAFNPEQWVPAGYKVERVGNYKEVSKE